MHDVSQRPAALCWSYVVVVLFVERHISVCLQKSVLVGVLKGNLVTRVVFLETNSSSNFLMWTRKKLG